MAGGGAWGGDGGFGGGWCRRAAGVRAVGSDGGEGAGRCRR